MVAPGVRERVKGQVYDLVIPLPRDPVTGRYPSRSMVFRGTLAKAKVERGRLVSAAKEGKIMASKGTLAELFDLFLVHLVRAGRSPNTVNEYRKKFDRYVRPVLGAEPVDRLTQRHLDALYASLAARVGSKTISNVHAALSSALSWGVKKDWLTDNPARKADPPAGVHREPRIPTQPVLLELITRARDKDPAMSRLWWVDATLAARRAEMVSARVGPRPDGDSCSFVDWDHNLLVIGRSVVEIPASYLEWLADQGVRHEDLNALPTPQRGKGRQAGTPGGHLFEKATKNEKTRPVAIGTRTMFALREQRAYMERRAAEGMAELRPDAFLWSDDLDGATPWKPDRITHFFNRIRAEMGLANLVFHDVRRFMVSKALDGGAGGATVARRAGHDPNIMWTVYGARIDATDRWVAELAEQALDPAALPPGSRDSAGITAERVL